MVRKVGRLAGLVLVGWMMAALGLVLLPTPPGAARSEQAGGSLPPPASAPPVTATALSAPSPPEPQTLVIRYRGRSAPPALLRALSDLQAAGQVLAVDPLSAPGRVFVLGDRAAIEALAGIEGVTGIAPVDDSAPPEAPPALAQLSPGNDQLLTPPRTSAPLHPRPATPPTPAPPAPPATAASPPLPPCSPAPPRPQPPIPQPPCAPLPAAAPARVQANGFITGLVTADDGGAPLANVYVYAQDPATYVWASNYTNAGGVYSISVSPGSYRVSFEPFDYHISEHYDNILYNQSASATLVSVASGEVVTGINAGLAPGVQISGTITDRATTAPLNSIAVDVQGLTPANYYSYGYSSAGGIYTTAPGLPPGEYRVLFYDYNNLYATEYYSHAFRPGLATTVTLTTTHRGGINAAMVKAGAITGTVRGSGPLSDVQVTAYYAAETTWVNYSTTDINGYYRLAGLAPIGYKLKLLPPDNRYITEWYQGQSAWDTATPITPTSGVTITLDITLTRAAVITGLVTDALNGAPLSGIWVSLYNAGDDSYRTGTATNISGTYRLDGLLAGGYKLQFWDGGGNYLSEYYNNRPDLASADPVTVTAGTTATANAALTAGAHITGTVTAEGSGAPLDGVSVYLYNAGDDSYRANAATNISGTYRFDGLPAGGYKLKFQDFSGNYLNEYYNNRPDLASADPVTVT
ncbi:MAG: carboxypeptidase regulatory-like domain-containing protein, partial [Anaerolineae bacterium]